MFGALRKSGWTGLAVVVGAAALAPTVLPALGRTVRPLAKSALKGGFVAVELARERLAELAEAGDDLLAEVRSELDAERRARVAETEPAASAAAPSGDAVPPLRDDAA